jgi:hypothetical protein
MIHLTTRGDEGSVVDQHAGGTASTQRLLVEALVVVMSKTNLTLNTGVHCRASGRLRDSKFLR